MEYDTCIEKGKTRVYEGESSHSARIRGSEHLSDLDKQRSSSVPFKRKENEHKHETMKITK